MIPSHRLATLVAACALSLGGCLSLDPTYRRPSSPAPPTWPQGAAYAPTSLGSAPDLPWRSFVTDPKLREVISLALANNRNLRVAIQNIEESHAQYRVQRAALFPEIDANANALYEHEPSGLLGLTTGTSTGLGGAAGAGAGTTGLGGLGGATTTAAGGSSFFRLYSADLGISSYELDLWGRLRSLTRQAFEQYLASAQAQRTSRITLISEVAIDYLTLSADDQRLKTAQDTLKADLETLNITQARFRDAVASELDVRQAATAVDQARSDIAADTAQGAEDVNALNLVVGASVPAALLPGGQDASLPTLADVPAGLSSDVLLQRPDVLQAEHQLLAYNANIGAARAAFFPTVSLTASGGSTSLYLDRLFGGGTGSWSFEPNITLPIFDAGKNRANLKYAKAERAAAVAQYELAIQTAFEETANALAVRGTASRQIAAQEALVNDSAAALMLSRARYLRGIDTYLNVLDAQRSLYSAQQTLITARLSRSSNLVTLYRVLGGGVR